MNVLLVDDERSMRDFLSLLLQKKGCSFETAESGKSGQRKLKERQFDILVTDVKMPDITGIELMKYAKECYPSILCILITAYATKESAIQALKL